MPTPVLTRFQFWTLSLLGAVSLVLVAANIAMITQNRKQQAEVAARAQYIQQTSQLESLHRELVRVLTEMAVRNNDTALRDMLAKQGITVPQPPTGFGLPETGAAPASTLPKGGK